MALPLVVRARQEGVRDHCILKVVDAREFARNGWAPEKAALLLDGEVDTPPGVMALPWAALVTRGPARDVHGFIGARVSDIAVGEAVKVGDALELVPNARNIRVLYRRGDRGNVLFATERCNSYCLMCSQPPRDLADDWRTAANIRLVELIDKEEKSLGISGGEPTLLGPGLIELIRACKAHLPDTDLQVLTNGRAFSSTELARMAREVDHPKLQWDVPLYAETAAIHDYVVQAKGAFEETLSGLYRLAEYQQHVEIRVVLHKQSIPRLLELARFIYRNLSFVRHVALMGLEPIGFARANRASLWIDPIDYQEELRAAVDFLDVRGMPLSIYNLPLCVVAPELHKFARMSISDWKNIYLDECQRCSKKQLCGGFFASVDKEWVSRGVRPL